MFPIDMTLTAADVAFPATVSHLMPKHGDIPRDHENRDLWRKLFNDWFYSGLTSLNLQPRAGVNETAALRHVKCVMGSYEPKHEHKTAAFAWLMSQWFSGGTWEATEFSMTQATGKAKL